MPKPCEICKQVTSKLKPIKCPCGKTPRVAHFHIIIDWSVSCECGRETEDYNTYHQAVSRWNKEIKCPKKISKKIVKEIKCLKKNLKKIV